MEKQTEKNILDLIKEQIGLELNLCDYFTGIKNTVLFKNDYYINYLSSKV